MFDIESFAVDYGIELHYPPEKNVTNGWVNMQCPFCLFDKSWHLGMNQQSGIFSCWKCGHKSGPQKVVQQLLNISWQAAAVIVQKYQIGNVVTEQQKIQNRKLTLPDGLMDNLSKNARQYLINRGFDPDYLMAHYKIVSANMYSKLRGRIFIPIYFGHQPVNYVARDYTGLADAKYVLCPNDHALVPRNELLYNFDSVRNVGMVVEGVTDVWAIGKGAFATLGTQFSQAQLSLIGQKQLEQVFITYDSDAYMKARQLAVQLASVVQKVELIMLDNGDPAEQDDNTKTQLKGLLL